MTGTTLPQFQSIRFPLGIVFAVIFYRQVVILIGVQVVARGATDWIAVALLWLASALLCLRLIDFFADYLRAVVVPDHRRTSLAALILLRKVAKALIIAVLTVQILEIMGFDVTTAIAALGIGGLALALGAQKTVENLVGSVNVVADRPVEVGDFCKFGDISGTVEDIGIRSTKVRTPARTIVTVPNGTFAAMQIENFSVRDQFLFQTVLSLRPNTTTDQLTSILADIRNMLTHSKTVAPGGRANLIEMTRTSLDVEIFCYIEASDYVAFLNAREELLISVLGTVTRNGSLLAFPPSLVELVNETAPLEPESEFIPSRDSVAKSGA
jgi:MscS family membrane protein